eukprot:5763-Heterococcus_DN1.PRE.1
MRGDTAHTAVHSRVDETLSHQKVLSAAMKRACVATTAGSVQHVNMTITTRKYSYSALAQCECTVRLVSMQSTKQLRAVRACVHAEASTYERHFATVC